MKGIRTALIPASLALSFWFCQVNPGLIEAAPQVGGTQAENPPAAGTPGPQDPGATAYAKHCAMCHGAQREGTPPVFPSLVGVTNRMSDAQITDLVHTGKGRMPSFANIQGAELTSLLHYLATPASSQTEGGEDKGGEGSDIAQAGRALFRQNCAFCHGRDAMGGETGPDLTESNLVQSDKTGEQIAKVISEGRPNNKMPSFKFSAPEMRSLIAFIRARENAAKTHPGGRRGVSVEDLQTGNAEAGKQYFEGAGGCTKCHSATGDLAGIAKRYQGLRLEEHMLYPRDAKSTVSVSLPTGEKITGTLAYQDEFTIALRDADGIYHSWPTDRVKFTVQSPAEAHVEQFPKYTDDDIHNLMAYLQTLK